ncbi:MAG TPA: dienelactone hydrolase [Gammaproteobacteria bacterium]|nr:dienelactone hydrolase [Gammaproteobacteria bacterium]
MIRIVLGAVSVIFSATVVAQSNRIDVVRGDAPELAYFGQYDIGVSTLEMSARNRVDVVNTERGGDNVIYDRSLTVELWYPADLNGQAPGVIYEAITRNPEIVAQLQGRALRGAVPNSRNAPYPLVIISHGHPGNRFLMSHTAESLASKGYIVASIDHTDSTYESDQNFYSTLYNRPLDQRFVLETLAGLNKSDWPLAGMIDADSTGIIGYSMGGYGLINNLGGAYNPEMVDSFLAPPNALLLEHTESNPDFRSNLEARIKAGIAVGPWGMNNGLWREKDLAGIMVPTFYIAGSADTVSGYDNGTRSIFEGAINSDRYLLTYKNAGHNAGAPIPVPIEVQASEGQVGSSHYTDPVWDNVRMNNIMDHFVTAYFDYYLKGDMNKLNYFDLLPDGADGVYSVRNGEETDEHNYWRGFSSGGAVGLRMEHLAPGQ